MDTIIVGVDDSETARVAARAAARLAWGLGAHLHVVSAVDKEKTVVVEGPGDDKWWFSSTQEARQGAEAVAKTLAAEFPGLGEIGVSVGEGKAHDVLVDEATRLEATTIVVGNRRMQGAGRVLGSIANSVAHNAPCDVYIVKTT
jgi:nucleotide-binding universal stress UspA family protein